MRRGVEPVVAEIIIIAATIIIAIGFISWIMGFWNVHSTTHLEGIQFYPDSYIAGNSIYLHLKTHIKPSITFYVEVPGANIEEVSVIHIVTGTVTVDADYKVTASVGSEFWLKVDLESLPSSNVKIKIYSEQGHVYWYTVSR